MELVNFTTGSLVWMVLQRQSSVGIVDIFGGSVGGNSQDFVEVGHL